MLIYVNLPMFASGQVVVSGTVFPAAGRNK